MKNKNCIHCKKEFQPKSTSINGSGTTTKFCSFKCYHVHRIGRPHGKTNERKNYRIYGGYRWILVPLGYRNDNKKAVLKSGRYIQEHRYVMEQELGRSLTRNEDVHHINFNRLDNRSENLMVLTRRQHRQLEDALAKLAMQKLRLTRKDLGNLINLQIT